MTALTGHEGSARCKSSGPPGRVFQFQFHVFPKCTSTARSSKARPPSLRRESVTASVRRSMTATASRALEKQHLPRREGRTRRDQTPSHRPVGDRRRTAADLFNQRPVGRALVWNPPHVRPRTDAQHALRRKRTRGRASHRAGRRAHASLGAQTREQRRARLVSAPFEGGGAGRSGKANEVHQVSGRWRRKPVSRACLRG